MNTCRICNVPLTRDNKQPKIGQPLREFLNICVDCYFAKIASIVNAAMAEMKEEEIALKNG